MISLRLIGEWDAIAFAYTADPKIEDINKLSCCAPAVDSEQGYSNGLLTLHNLTMCKKII